MSLATMLKVIGFVTTILCVNFDVSSSFTCSKVVKTIQDVISCANLTNKESWVEEDLLSISKHGKTCISSRFTIVDDKLIHCDFPLNNTFFISTNLSLYNSSFPEMGIGPFIIKSNGEFTRHPAELLEYVKTGKYKILSNIPIIITKDYHKATELIDPRSNHGVKYVIICKNLPFYKRAIAFCDTIGMIMFTCVVMVSVLILAIFIRFLKFLACGHSTEVKYENVRYVQHQGRFVKKQDRFSASRSNKTRSRFITFLCFTIPIARGCDIVPFSQGESELCIKTNCSNVDFTTLYLAYTGQTACLDFESIPVSVKLLDIQHICKERLEYYTPIGKLDIEEKWRCDGDDCTSGTRSDEWNEMTKSHPGGWFRGCWGWSDQCHTLIIKPDYYEMCKVVSCPSFEFIYKFEVTYGSWKEIIFTREDMWARFNSMQLLILGDQRAVYGNRYVICDSKKFKAGINSRNEHDTAKIGSIQCSRKALNGSCSFSFDSLYKLDFEGKLLNTIDFTYKSSMSLITELGDDVVFDLNNHSPLKVVLRSEHKVQKMEVSKSYEIENITITGYMYEKEGATVEYDCLDDVISQQFLCPEDLSFFLHCWVKGRNSLAISYLSNKKRSQVTCKTVNSLGESSTQLIYIDLENPIIGLLKIERMSPISGNYETSFDVSIQKEAWNIIKAHYILFSILLVYIIAVVIHQIHLAF